MNGLMQLKIEAHPSLKKIFNLISSYIFSISCQCHAMPLSVMIYRYPVYCWTENCCYPCCTQQVCTYGLLLLLFTQLGILAVSNCQSMKTFEDIVFCQYCHLLFHPRSICYYARCWLCENQMFPCENCYHLVIYSISRVLNDKIFSFYWLTFCNK